MRGERRWDKERKEKAKKEDRNKTEFYFSISNNFLSFDSR